VNRERHACRAEVRRRRETLERNCRRVHLLAAGKTPKFARDGSYLTVTVPSLLDHEIVAIDL
jgi:hypothetical protein